MLRFALSPGSPAWIFALCASRSLSTMWIVAYSTVLTVVQASWGLSYSDAGLIQSAFPLGYMVSMFFTGFMSDHYGAKRTFIWGGVALGVSTIAFVLFAHDFWSAYCLHALTGLCAGGTYAPALALVTEHVERDRRGRAMGLLLASSSASYALCLGIVGLALSFTDWRGGLGIVALLAFLAWPASLAALRGTPNVVHPRPPGESFLSALPLVIRDRRSMLSISGYTFHNWELLCLWAWLPAFVSAALSAQGGAQAGVVSYSLLLSALAYVANIGGSLVGGVMADRLGRTQTILVWSCASALLSTFIGCFMSLPVSLLIAMICLCNFAAIADSSTHSTVLAETVRPHIVGAAYAVRSVLGFGAGAISPIVFGAVLDSAGGSNMSTNQSAWVLAWTTLGLVALLGPLSTWKLHRLSSSG